MNLRQAMKLSISEIEKLTIIIIELSKLVNVHHRVALGIILV